MPPITSSYLLCTTPRSGSNFLCEVLWSTGVAGRPDDYFWNPPFWQERWKVRDFSAYLERLLRQGTSGNGVFGCKLMWDYLGELLPQFARHTGVEMTSVHAILAATFPNLRYVWLTRQDKVRQGISYYRALETGIWRSTDTGTAPYKEPQFDAQAIAALIQLSSGEDQGWRDFFQRTGLSPLVVTYEELAVSPARVVECVLAHLELPPMSAFRDRHWKHQRQADTLTEAWVQRYLDVVSGS